MKKNYFIKGFRTDHETFELIDKISKITGFQKQRLIRWFLNKSITQLKADIQQVGGIENLSFDIKEIRRINS